ncbi:MAG: MoaD/ThiS family protein [Phycisphaerae bacterium]
MTVHVRLFGPSVDLASEPEATLTLDEGVTLGSVAGRIAERWPKLGGAPGMRLALNRAYAALDTVLHEGDEIAVIPPVSGG